MTIPRIERVITILDEVFWKLRVSFDGVVTKKNVFSEFSNHIETHLDVVVEVLKVQRSVYFEFCLDEDFTESWWADIMFQSPDVTIFCELSHSNGGTLMLASTTVVSSWAFGEPFWVREDFKVLIWSVIAEIIVLKSSVNFVIFSSQSCLLDLIS